jgi:NADPH:quinone reductase-like Zn-dependent oxidoreductase
MKYSVLILMTSMVLPTFAFAQESSKPAAFPAAMMKGCIVPKYGGPEVLKYEDVSRPEPKEDEILIRVMAAAVNPIDAMIRQGRFKKVIGIKLPLIPGMDVAGVVEKTGEKITKFKTGDPVYAYLNFKTMGGYAEFAIAKEDETSSKPKSLTYEQAAAVPLAATTAWQALVETAKLGAGQTVLIHGGSGGVGHFAIQIAKARGAKVIAVASTKNQDLLKQLGADQAIDYTTTKFEEVVKDVDVVLDAVRGDTLQRSYGVVKKGGIVVTITGHPNQAELDKRGIRGVPLGAYPDAKVLEELTTLIEAKKLNPIVSHTFPLAEASKAHEQIETRHTRGKVVLKVADAQKK